MQKLIFTGMLCLALSLQQQTGEVKEQKITSVGCGHTINGYFWDLTQLQRSSEEGDYKVQYETNSEARTVNFNICEYTNEPCKENQIDFGNIRTVGGSCTSLTAESSEDRKVNFLDHKTPESGIQINWKGGGKCVGDKNYSLTINLKCDPKATGEPKPTLVLSKSADLCHITTELTSDHACPVISLNALRAFLEEYYWFFALIGIALGIFEMLFGVKLFKPTIFIAAMLAVTALVVVRYMFNHQLFAYFVIIPADTKPYYGWIALGVAVLLGIVAGFLIIKFYKVGVFVLGAWLGAVVGMLLFNLFLYKISEDHSDIVLWVSIIILGIIAGIVAVKLFEPAVILTTAICGAYAIVRGIGVFAGAYPNEFHVVQDIKEGKIKGMPWQIYAYFAAILILSVGGTYFQCKKFKGTLDDKEKNE